MPDDIEKALEYIRESLDFSEALGSDDEDLMNWRRIETLLMKLQRYEQEKKGESK